MPIGTAGLRLYMTRCGAEKCRWAADPYIIGEAAVDIIGVVTTEGAAASEHDAPWRHILACLARRRCGCEEGAGTSDSALVGIVVASRRRLREAEAESAGGSGLRNDDQD